MNEEQKYEGSELSGRIGNLHSYFTLNAGKDVGVEALFNKGPSTQPISQPSLPAPALG